MPTFIPDSSTPTVTMAGVQAAKKELRRKMREVLRSIPKDSIVSQCQNPVPISILMSATRF